MNPETSSQAGLAKDALRQRLKAEVRGLEVEAKALESQKICQRVLEHPVWHNCRSVLGYIPLSDEPDIRRLLDQALWDGKTLFLPSFEENSGIYRARKITRLDRELVPGRFGILEPAPTCASDTLKHLDLALVPGVGFSANGCRLGRGNGYYDRLLSEAAGVKRGVAFECQLTEDVPREPHDIAMNWVILPSRWLGCNQAAHGI